MQRAFPQELRDMLYTHIIKEGIYKVEGVAKYGKATPEQSKRRSATPAHSQDVQYVGKPTLFELGLFCYQVTTFKIGGNVLEQHKLKSYTKEFSALLTLMVGVQYKVAVRINITLDNDHADALDRVIRFGDAMNKMHPNFEQLK
ncbi:hypothetical protein HBI56_053350 [Parastagonospora nodorum]|uniref:Uncharacterized protein n=1 Tax=Phaeosphaeria nodorum (strain SN15 / ATCC MYA-4574 / FGSC 10173) TaxID=321614 RepID=A0A7U2ICN8_PHANO|nr:hypothetical protein HBH56_098730 [Parastagonospora nodorum]QRD07401.1 hypothetical protein JI435_447400 [Parastagonospora nodorum SN15]KAH3930512.1 hypothetical protein HBH54_113050 [Parastagonospora nodorum]KAH3942777.1 hypothetical protein HBH53_182860 [Parastagonospora nodorum]KAH3964489.1 hypothetical protein HBH51_158960 [Parastagonospora nodorum]